MAIAVSRVVVVVREVCPSHMSWRWFEMPQYVRRTARPLVSIAVSRAAYMEILFEVAKLTMPWLQPLSSLKWAPLYATGTSLGWTSLK